MLLWIPLHVENNCNLKKPHWLVKYEEKEKQPSYIRHKDFLCPPPPSCSGYPPWNLKRAGLESSGRIASSSYWKTKRIVSCMYFFGEIFFLLQNFQIFWQKDFFWIFQHFFRFSDFSKNLDFSNLFWFFYGFFWFFGFFWDFHGILGFFWIFEIFGYFGSYEIFWDFFRDFFRFF